MNIENAAHPDNAVYGAFGHFGSIDHAVTLSEWTEQDWLDYDAQMAAEIAEWEAQEAEQAIFDDYDGEPPF